MQVSQNPNLVFTSNAINPNLIFCSSNYLSALKFKIGGFSGRVFPALKAVPGIPSSNDFSSTRHGRFAPFVAAAAAKRAGRTPGPDYYTVLNVSRNATLQEIKLLTAHLLAR
ncbi:UNVERIFIED_CONTAM: hypothetical protein Sangu_0092400 [Sesamum angustifolium]|uniref:Uncharacterized protein n=1 Tax=Sesamum angustifolium TaxID=2727405 RepID=A0AAW2RLG3_9LAMI